MFSGWCVAAFGWIIMLNSSVFSTLKMGRLLPKWFVSTYQTTQCHYTEDSIVNLRCRKTYLRAQKSVIFQRKCQEQLSHWNACRIEGMLNAIRDWRRSCRKDPALQIRANRMPSPGRQLIAAWRFVLTFRWNFAKHIRAYLTVGQ